MKNSAKIHYFAYGSNLHPIRLRERVPSAHVIGKICIQKYMLTFHKRSNDGSGKCTIVKTQNTDDKVFGVLFSLDSSEKNKLDTAEGNGYGYKDIKIKLSFQGQEFTAFTYVATDSHIDDALIPYTWYKEYVLLGAIHQKLPNEYINQIQQIQARVDEDSKRLKSNEEILAKIRSSVSKESLCSFIETQEKLEIIEENEITIRDIRKFLGRHK